MGSVLPLAMGWGHFKQHGVNMSDFITSVLSNNVIIAIVGLIISLGIIHLFNKYYNIPDNNPVEVAVEKAIEEVVKEETGVDVNLTPESSDIQNTQNK